jgi:hypothetical protein
MMSYFIGWDGVQEVQARVLRAEERELKAYLASLPPVPRVPAYKRIREAFREWLWAIPIILF